MEQYVELMKMTIVDKFDTVEFEEEFIGKFEAIDHVSVLEDYIKTEGLFDGNGDIKEDIEFVENGLVRFRISEDTYIYSELI